MPVRLRLSGLLTLLMLALAAATPLLALAEMPPAVSTSPSEPASSVSVALAAERPSWHDLPLTDARTGEPFTLADFSGKTVYVEPMATWCTNCRQQMSVIRDEVRGQVDPEQVVFVGLSVETNLSSETLASYAATHGFDWAFAVMTPELLQELAGTFGRTVANPPAVPHVIIGPDGTTSELGTGHHSAEQLLARLAAAGAAAQP